MLDAIARLGGRGRPGGRFAYRNSNYVVAAEIAERAGGRDIEALLAELVAGPLGLRGFSFARGGGRHAARRARIARCWAARSTCSPSRAGACPRTRSGPVWGDGGIAASAGELARFLEALLAGELVAARDAARDGPARARARAPAYGLGIMARREDGAIVAGHDGHVLRLDRIVVDGRRHRHDGGGGVQPGEPAASRPRGWRAAARAALA